MEKKTSLFDNGLIWFGAGVSLAEILTGTYFSTLGFGRGLAAILLGHVIGCQVDSQHFRWFDLPAAQCRD